MFNLKTGLRIMPGLGRSRQGSHYDPGPTRVMTVGSDCSVTMIVNNLSTPRATAAPEALSHYRTARRGQPVPERNSRWRPSESCSDSCSATISLTFELQSCCRYGRSLESLSVGLRQPGSPGPRAGQGRRCTMNGLGHGSRSLTVTVRSSCAAAN